MTNLRTENYSPTHKPKEQSKVGFVISQEKQSPNAYQLSYKEAVRAAIIHNSGFEMNSPVAVKTITEFDKKKRVKRVDSFLNEKIRMESFINKIEQRNRIVNKSKKRGRRQSMVDLSQYEHLKEAY